MAGFLFGNIIDANRKLNFDRTQKKERLYKFQRKKEAIKNCKYQSNTKIKIEGNNLSDQERIEIKERIGLQMSHELTIKYLKLLGIIFLIIVIGFMIVQL